MKQLTLLRHAKSSWDEPGLNDRDRPLAKRGQRDAPLIGRRLAARGLAPQLLLASNAVRARQTAELVAPAFARSRPALERDRRIYLASPGELLAVIAGQNDTIDSLVLVGHNPGMTTLCNMLLPDLGLQNLPTAGAVSILCDTSSWSAIDAAAFSLAFYEYPKNPSPPSV